MWVEPSLNMVKPMDDDTNTCNNGSGDFNSCGHGSGLFNGCNCGSSDGGTDPIEA